MIRIPNEIDSWIDENLKEKISDWIKDEFIPKNKVKDALDKYLGDQEPGVLVKEHIKSELGLD